LLDQKAIKPYICKIIFYQATNKNNPFWKLYRQESDNIPEQTQTQEPFIDQQYLLDQLTENEKKVLALYIEEQSINKIHKLTNIDRLALTKYWKSITNKLKEVL
jgi:DNA-directed RNA polymerase specialized sigma subunit